MTQPPPAAPPPPADPESAGGALVIGPPSLRRALALAVALLLVAEVLATAALSGRQPPLRWYDAATELRVQMMADRGPVDVVFAGTSMAWQGLVPAAWTAADPQGRTAFNAGLNGAVPVVTGPWLTDVVEPSLQPRTVVWGLSPLDLAPAYGDAQLAAWRDSLEGRPGVLGAVERTASSASTLVARRAQLRRPAELLAAGSAVLARDRAAAEALTGPDGERLGFDGERTADGARVQQARLAGFSPDAADVRAVVRTALALRSRGVEVVLADLPVPPALVEQHPRGQDDVDLSRRTVAVLAEELGIRHVGIEGEWGDADFVDHTHLTADAAARYTGAVARQLAATAEVVSAEALAPAEAAAPGAVDPDAQALDPGAPDPAAPAAPAAGGDQGLATWLGDAAAAAVLRPMRLAAISQVGCLGRPVGADARAAADARVAELADVALRDHLGGLLRAADGMAGACGTEPAWRAAAVELLRAAERVAVHVEQAIALEGPRTQAGAVDRASTTATTPQLAVHLELAYERLAWLLQGGANPRLSRNEVWWSYAERGHVGRLEQLADAGADVRTLVLGTSQARVGVDDEVLSARTGALAVNAGIDGGTVDLTRRWAPFAVDRARPERVVLLVSGIDVLTAVGPPCPTARRDAFVDALAVTETAFAGVPWLDGLDPLRIVAASDPAAPLASPLVQAYQPDPAQDHPLLTPQDAVERGRPYLVAYSRSTPCPERLEDVQQLGAELTAAGIEVVVVAPPIRSELRQAAPPGALAELDRLVAEAAAAGGARFLGYTELLPDSQMGDLVHPTAEGAQVLTQRLAADLGAG